MYPGQEKGQPTIGTDHCRRQCFQIDLSLGTSFSGNLMWLRLTTPVQRTSLLTQGKCGSPPQAVHCRERGRTHFQSSPEDTSNSDHKGMTAEFHPCALT